MSKREQKAIGMIFFGIIILYLGIVTTNGQLLLVIGILLVLIGGYALARAYNLIHINRKT